MDKVQASTIKTAQELRGRLIHDGGGQYIVAAWVADEQKAKEIGRAGCAMTWPDGEWRWLEDLTVSGTKAALLPKLSKEQRDMVRRSLAIFLIPYGDDTWVAKQVGYYGHASIHFLRKKLGIPTWSDRTPRVPKEREIQIAKLFLEHYSCRRIAIETGLDYHTVDYVLSMLKEWPPNGPRVRPRVRVITNIKKRHGVTLK